MRRVLLDYGAGKYHYPTKRYGPDGADTPRCNPYGRPHYGDIKFDDEVAVADICKRCIKFAAREEA